MHFLNLFFLCLLLPNTVLAAPHIGGRPEPKLDRVGTALTKRLAAKALAPGALRAPSGYPADVSVLFLRVDFQDESEVIDWSPCYSSMPVEKNGDPDPNTTGLGTWSDPAYSYLGDPDYWMSQSKLRFPEYYSEVSNGKLSVSIDVSSTVYRLPWPMCYYGKETETDLRRLIVDSVAAAADVNYSLYDAVLVVHAGAGEETDINNDTSRNIWSLYYGEECIDTDEDTDGCQPLPLLRNGISFSEFILMPQTDSQDEIIVDPLGVYVHEFGHWLGLPDLYDTSWLNPTDGIGMWGVMGYGLYNGDPPGSMPPHPEAWSKLFLGWISAEPAVAGADAGPMTLSPVQSVTPRAIRVPASSLYPESQYFLLENRRKTGYDAALPGEGMLVWLVNQATVDYGLSNNTVNVRARGVRLIEADGLSNLLDGTDGDAGSAGDPFPGTETKSSLSPLSFPSSAPFTGQAWVSLRDIVTNGQDISFTLGYAPLPPRDISAVFRSLDAKIKWSPNDEADLSHYNVYRSGAFLASAFSPLYIDRTGANLYPYRVTAVDIDGNESSLSESVTPRLPVLPSGGGESDCFIATAAFGSALDPHVLALREFRDRRLLTNSAGRAFVSFYYRHSPPIADYIRRHEALKSFVRLALLPPVLIVQYPLPAAGLFFAATLAMFCLRRFRLSSKIR